MFWEAKAKGRLAVADRELRELENATFCVANKAWGYGDTGVARELIMQHAPDDIAVYKAKTAFSDATEQVSVCGRMIELLGGKKP